MSTRDRAAEVLAAHFELATIPDEGSECDCGAHIADSGEYPVDRWREHQADALDRAGLLTHEPEDLAKIKADAIREAAGWIDGGTPRAWNGMDFRADETHWLHPCDEAEGRMTKVTDAERALMITTDALRETADKIERGQS